MTETSPAELQEVLAEIGAAILGVYSDHGRQPPLPDGIDPTALSALFDEPLPLRGRSAVEVVRDIRRRVVPNCLNLANPLAFGLMIPHPLPLPAALDGLISALNQNLGCAWRTAPGAIQVELRTLRWLIELVGLPAESEGHFTTGGTASNVTAMRLALQRSFPEVKAKGVRQLAAQPVVYASDQGHFSIDRAAQLLGLGQAHVRKVDSRPDLTMDVDHLATLVIGDRQAGLAPLMVVGTAGTTSSGAIDPLPAIADYCAAQGLWFHVDAAYGGALVLSASRSLLAGIELADSVTLDPHKWLFIPLSLGALLTRHAGLLAETFGAETAYLGRRHVAAPEASPSGFFEVSLDTSRRFNGLKLWATLHHLGTVGLARIIDRQLELTGLLGARLRRINGIELAHAPHTNIVCFRFVPASAGDEALVSALQAQVLDEVELEAECWLSMVSLKGKSFLRVNLLHYGLEEAHVHHLADAVAAVCGRLSPVPVEAGNT